MSSFCLEPGMCVPGQCGADFTTTEMVQEAFIFTLNYQSERKMWGHPSGAEKAQASLCRQSQSLWSNLNHKTATLLPSQTCPSSYPENHRIRMPWQPTGLFCTNAPTCTWHFPLRSLRPRTGLLLGPVRQSTRPLAVHNPGTHCSLTLFTGVCWDVHLPGEFSILLGCKAACHAL